MSNGRDTQFDGAESYVDPRGLTKEMANATTNHVHCTSCGFAVNVVLLPRDNNVAICDNCQRYLWIVCQDGRFDTHLFPWQRAMCCESPRLAPKEWTDPSGGEHLSVVCLACKNTENTL